MTEWRKLFATHADHSLEFFPPKIIDGVVTATPPSEVFEEGIKEWRFPLVAQFLGKPPNFSLLHRVVSKLWERKGTVSVKYAGLNLYLFQFENDDACDWILENGPWHVHNNPMILRKWEPNLTKIAFDLDKLPLWIHLHHVPLELFNRIGLSHLASAVGVPLYIDSITAAKKRLQFARVRVEIGADCDIPDSVSFMLENGSTAGHHWGNYRQFQKFH